MLRNKDLSFAQSQYNIKVELHYNVKIRKEKNFDYTGFKNIAM